VYETRKRFWLSRANEIRAADDEAPRSVAIVPVGAWCKGGTRGASPPAGAPDKLPRAVFALGSAVASHTDA
jgi:hypothetical protein